MENKCGFVKGDHKDLFKAMKLHWNEIRALIDAPWSAINNVARDRKTYMGQHKCLFPLCEQIVNRISPFCEKHGRLMISLKGEKEERHIKVYFILASGAGKIKIGRTFDPEWRLKELQIGSPIPLVLMAEAKGSAKVESFLHSYFDEYRENGEWFRAHESILDVAEIALDRGSLLEWVEEHGGRVY